MASCVCFYLRRIYEMFVVLLLFALLVCIVVAVVERYLHTIPVWAAWLLIHTNVITIRVNFNCVIFTWKNSVLNNLSMCLSFISFFLPSIPHFPLSAWTISHEFQTIFWRNKNIAHVNIVLSFENFQIHVEWLGILICAICQFYSFFSLSLGQCVFIVIEMGNEMCT